jgi:CheY-like chemotaxis protein
MPLPSATLLHNVRVLIVDDDSHTRELVSVILADSAAEVRAVESAAKAVDELQSWRPDVIVSDIDMPVEDGYSFISRVRRCEQRRHGRVTPAIAFTAHSDTSDRVRALTAGFQAVITKPTTPILLVSVIEKLAKRYLKLSSSTSP